MCDNCKNERNRLGDNAAKETFNKFRGEILELLRETLINAKPKNLDAAPGRIWEAAATMCLIDVGRRLAISSGVAPESLIADFVNETVLEVSGLALSPEAQDAVAATMDTIIRVSTAKAGPIN